MLTIGSYLHRILLLGDGNRLAFHLAVVPESTLKAQLAIHATLVEVRIQNLVVHQVASIKGDDLVFFKRLLIPSRMVIVCRGVPL